MKFKYKNIVALTTDPMDSLRGYSFIFFQLFKFIDDNYESINVQIITNNGNSSNIVTGKNIIKKNLNKNHRMSIKTIIFIFFLLKKSLKFNRKDTVFVVNCEIPELFVGFILKIFFFYNVYCIVHDDLSYKEGFFISLITFFRKVFIFLIGKLIFVNKMSAKKLWWLKKNSIYFIPNPVF